MKLGSFSYFFISFKTVRSVKEVNVPPVSAITVDLTLRAFTSVHLCTYIVLRGFFSLSETVGPTTKAVTFYSKWSCATSEVDVLVRRFKLAPSRYINDTSNGLLDKTNEQRIFF